MQIEIHHSIPHHNNTNMGYHSMRCEFYVCAFSSHITNREPSLFEFCYRSSFMFFFLLFWCWFSIKYCHCLHTTTQSVRTQHTICGHWAWSWHQRQKRKLCVLSSPILYISVCFFRYLSRKAHPGAGKETPTEQFLLLFRFACEITFCYYFVLFLFLLFFSSSYSF